MRTGKIKTEAGKGGGNQWAFRGWRWGGEGGRRSSILLFLGVFEKGGLPARYRELPFLENQQVRFISIVAYTEGTKRTQHLLLQVRRCVCELIWSLCVRGVRAQHCNKWFGPQFLSQFSDFLAFSCVFRMRKHL